MRNLQTAYADKPVRFLLFPCNQFAHQEPKANSEIKQFAEQYINLTQGNVFLFAKSNLNHVPCTYSGADACTSTSTMCCTKNDRVYDLLLSYPLKCLKCNMQTSPQSPIGWNFNKIFFDSEGRPWTNEILPADDFDMSSILDQMIAKAAPDTMSLFSFVSSWTLCLLAAVLFAAIATASLVAYNKRPDAQSCREEGSCYLRVA